MRSPAQDKGPKPEQGGVLRLKPLERRDLQELSSVHRAAFSESALTALGSEAVYRYYRWLLDDCHDSFCLGGWRGKSLDGFIFAGHFRGAMGGFINRNRKFLITRVILRPWLVTNREFRRRMRIGWRALGIRRKTGARASARSADYEPPGPHFGVLSIAAHPRAWGSGIAETLMDHADTEAMRRGVHTMVLTVHPTNTRAVRFYERLGWQKIPENTSWDGRMHKRLESEEIAEPNHLKDGRY
jgi:ribosomal protein S18 acetylase RimI-like enzyme